MSLTWAYSPQQLRRAARAGSGTPSLQTGCVAFWKLGEASGTRVDSTGRGNDLSPTNAPGNAAGIVGNALAVARASSQFLSRANPADLRTGGVSFTIAAWGLLTTNGSSEYPLLGRYSGVGYLLDYIGGQGMRFYFGGSNVQASTPGVWSTGTWHLVLAWYDLAAQSINIQVDNGTVYTAGSVTDPADNVSQFAIGTYGDTVGPNYWDGRVDAAGFWRRLLTSGEKAALWAGGAGLEWPF